jgi:hypothetical protein
MNATAAGYVRSGFSWCYPEDRPILPPVMAFTAAYAFSGLFHAFAHFCLIRSPSYFGKQAQLLEGYGLSARGSTFHGALVRLRGFVTLSEEWMLYVPRIVFLVCCTLSFVLAAACFVQPLPITMALLGNAGACKVACSAFAKKEHGINAAILVEIHLFMCCLLNASFIRLEPGLAPGAWIVIMTLVCLADAAFLSYPGVVAAFNHHALAVSLYLVVVERAALALALASTLPITTATFPLFA